MKYWLITDTHFAHKAMIDFCNRPPDFDLRIIKAWARLVQPGDVVIHLGDITIHGDGWAHEQIRALPGRKILTRGNHDSKSLTWYMENGWDFACDSFMLDRLSKKILFSHRPQKDTGEFDINIHGHFHNNPKSYTEPELQKIAAPVHRLLAIEYTHYEPVLLETFLYELSPKIEKRRK
jgi:calcineurin-like phosphoesterase family protein